jgi:hypothetical protein
LERHSAFRPGAGAVVEAIEEPIDLRVAAVGVEQMAAGGHHRERRSPAVHAGGERRYASNIAMRGPLRYSSYASRFSVGRRTAVLASGIRAGASALTMASTISS